MSWFGWLTKGQLEVSVADRLTFFAELAALLVVVFLIAGAKDKFDRWRKK